MRCPREQAHCRAVKLSLDRRLGGRVSAGRDMPFGSWRGGSMLGHYV